MTAPRLDPNDVLRRAGRVAARRWPGASLHDLDPLPGGISSLTFAARLTRPDAPPRRVVIKVAPPGLPPVHNRDVLRQARILLALHGRRGVPVPQVLLTDRGDPPGQPPLFVMTHVDGQAYEPGKDLSPQAPAPATVAARAHTAARTLAALQAVDPAQAGLREPALSVTGELERWARLFATAGANLRGEEEQVHRRLAAGAPPGEPPAILHGDYRLGNLQFDGARLGAVIDWEIWSLGDPRFDIAWLMAWCDPVARFVARRDAANAAAAAAMPSPEELLATYRTARPHASTESIEWFMAAGYYKIAATLAVLAKRNRRAPEPDPALELVAASLPDVLRRARELLS